jgi:DNA-binding NarL/FixJ family response regulator
VKNKIRTDHAIPEEGNQQMIEVIIADSHYIIHAGLHSMLEEVSDIKIVGEATTGNSAIDLAYKLKPDVVIIELSMPDMNGFITTTRILENNPDVKVLVLSMHADRWNVERALKTGASGYLVKNCTPEELSLAIRTVFEGGTYLSSEIAHLPISY